MAITLDGDVNTSSFRIILSILNEIFDIYAIDQSRTNFSWYRRSVDQNDDVVFQLR